MTRRPPRPHFHDAYLLEITLRGGGPSTLRIHGRNTTNHVDEKGYLRLEKHAVVTLTLEEVTHVALDDFDLPKAIINSLQIGEAGRWLRDLLGELVRRWWAYSRETAAAGARPWAAHARSLVGG